MIKNKITAKIPFGVSLPKELVNKIDKKRGDVSRSRFILRLLEGTIDEAQQCSSLNRRKKLSVTKVNPPAFAIEKSSQ